MPTDIFCTRKLQYPIIVTFNLIYLFQIQQNKFAAFQGTTEYRGRVCTTALTLANPDLVNESGIAVAQYLRRVVPRLDLGLELVYQYGKNVPGTQFSTVQYALRYTGMLMLI